MTDPADKTVDAQELARFEALARDWWDPKGPMKALHAFNGPRLAHIRDVLLRRFSKDGARLDGLSVLDVGCGGGLMTEPLAALGARVTGIDASPRNIAVAKSHAEAEGLTIDYRNEMADALSSAGESYDVVLSLEVVEHVADLPAFLAACCSLVKPGGLLFLATINRTVQSYLAAIIGAEYVLRMLPRGTHQWRKFPRPDELDSLIRPHGVVTERRVGMGFRPWATPKWQVTTDLSVNYLMQARKSDGTKRKP